MLWGLLVGSMEIFPLTASYWGAPRVTGQFLIIIQLICEKSPEEPQGGAFL